MNRSHYFNLIEERLSTLAVSIESRGRLNILDLNSHSEDFYALLLNKLFGWELKNLNAVNQNVEGIDLVDSKNRIIAQVSATAKKGKIESALSKNLREFEGYTFKFVSISKGAGHLRKSEYTPPQHLKFDPRADIIDIPSLLTTLRSLETSRQQELWKFVRSELDSPIEPHKIETNLATFIGILAEENWSQDAIIPETQHFIIDQKIAFNQLDTARILIVDYSVHHAHVDRIYADFDRQGVNKSLSVLDGIRRDYLQLKQQLSADELFFKLVENVAEKICASANYRHIPADELDLCVNILVVDAFIRCKIFEYPQGVDRAAS